MDDKFILMGLDDEKSKKVAEILKSKNCKKILDYLAEEKEASEKDIADALKIPLNTTEYNLKKLLEAGLVEKTKNFFWSKKGKKIPMYKLAKKHIVISPRSKPTMSALKTIIPLIIGVVILNLILISFLFPSEKQVQEMNKFNSLDELKDFLKENTVSGGGIGEVFEAVIGGMSKAGDSQTAGAEEYSTTNIQVEGVDEADIIKNDGRYIYTVSENKIKIIDAYPAEDMEILSEIDLRSNERILGIFINEDKLVAFSADYGDVIYEEKEEVRCMAIGCVLPPGEPKTNIYIYDISDREEPELDDTISLSGNYYDSRMIGNYVYVINNQYAYEDGILPALEKDNKTDVIKAEEIYYADVEDVSFQYTIILAVDIDTGETSEKTLLTGRTQTIFVSQDNIYTTYTKYPKWYADAVDLDEEKTIINKFSIDKEDVEYIATGEVPGHVLNQFSMDEYDGNFRIATTIGEVWRSDGEEKSKNNVYLLDEELNIIGELEGLAPGEKIYSVRFMGEKGYVVTFKKIDPLFVIDLSDPENPDVLGKLKIPGYSDYLHPYDENHIIGIGKETVEAEDSLKEQRNLDFAWYQGVKIAIFDVSDVENPIELHKVVIGDRGTDSYVLREHKAFLFDKEKELLVLPITLAEIDESRYDGDVPADAYGEYIFQGAYVYNLNLKDGFDLKGRVTHYDDSEVEKKSGHYWYGDKNVQRSLYMDDVLYTFSNEMIKANDLDDLDEISYIEI